MYQSEGGDTFFYCHNDMKCMLLVKILMTEVWISLLHAKISSLL